MGRKIRFCIGAVPTFTNNLLEKESAKNKDSGEKEQPNFGDPLSANKDIKSANRSTEFASCPQKWPEMGIGMDPFSGSS